MLSRYVWMRLAVEEMVLVACDPSWLMMMVVVLLDLPMTATSREDEGDNAVDESTRASPSQSSEMENKTDQTKWYDIDCPQTCFTHVLHKPASPRVQACIITPSLRTKPSEPNLNIPFVPSTHHREKKKDDGTKGL